MEMTILNTYRIGFNEDSDSYRVFMRAIMQFQDQNNRLIPYNWHTDPYDVDITCSEEEIMKIRAIYLQLKQ